MKLSYEQLQNAADNGGNFIEDLANGARGAVCGAYHNYKDWYHSNIDLLSPPAALLEQFWDNVCPLEPRYEPPIAPPSQDFTGGQCCNLTYRVRVRATNNGGASYFEVLLQGFYTGKILGIKQNKIIDSNGITRISHDLEWQSCNGTISKENVGLSNDDGQVNIVVKEVFTAYGEADNCGNPPSGELPPPIAPPNQIDDIVPVGEGDGDGLINVPIKINPQIQLPGLNVNVFAPIFKPEVNLNLNPQFKINPNININPTLNFNFGADGVEIGIGEPGGNNPDITDIETTNNINNIVSTTNTTNNIVNQVLDKLACNPCEKLEDILEILNYQPVYESATTGEFQSITRDNLFNLGYLEVELTKLPTSTKILFGNNSPNAMYTGWLFWRRDGFNFEKLQLTSEKSTFWAPKWANGFAINCTHNSRARCLYYLEKKD